MFDYIKMTEDEFKSLVQKIAVEKAHICLAQYPQGIFNEQLKRILFLLDKSHFISLEVEYNQYLNTYASYLPAQDDKDKKQAIGYLHHLAKGLGFDRELFMRLLTYFQWRSSTRLHIVEECLARSDNLIQGQVIQQTTRTFLRELQAIHAQIDQFLPVWLPDFDVDPPPA